MVRSLLQVGGDDVAQRRYFLPTAETIGPDPLFFLIGRGTVDRVGVVDHENPFGLEEVSKSPKGVTAPANRRVVKKRSSMPRRTCAAAPLQFSIASFR